MILPYNEWILGTTKLRNLGLSEGTLSSEKVHIRELYRSQFKSLEQY